METSSLPGLDLAVAKISRVHGPRRVLHQLRELIIRNNRSLIRRADTVEEIEWSHRVHTLLTNLVQEGEKTLPMRPQPRKITHRARKRPRAAGIAVLVLALLGAGRVSAQDWSAAAVHLEESIVRIVTQAGDGRSVCTGVVINEAAGYVAAAAHCFPPVPEPASIAADNRHAERVLVNHVLDVAVIKVKGLHGHQAKLRSDRAGVGLPVALVGYGFGALKSKYTFGWLADDGDDALLEGTVLMDAEAIPGMSGGGIFDQAGDLVTIVGGVLGTHAPPARLSYGPRPQVLAEFLKPYLPKDK